MSPEEERPLGQLISELADKTGTLVKQEVGLATVELTEKVAVASKNAALVGVGGAVAHAALLVLAASLVLALGTLVPIWIAALAVGAALAVVAFALLQRGIAEFKRLNPLPTQTIETFRENQSWVKKELSR